MSSIKDVYVSVWRKAFDFRSRADRREYWTFTLVNTAIIIAGYVAMGIAVAVVGTDSEAAPAVAAGVYGVIMLFSFAIFLPGIAVSVRRLHDRGTSGWLLLILFTGIGALILLIFYLLPGSPGPNQYGPPPSDALSPVHKQRLVQSPPDHV